MNITHPSANRLIPSEAESSCAPLINDRITTAAMTSIPTAPPLPVVEGLPLPSAVSVFSTDATGLNAQVKAVMQFDEVLRGRNTPPEIREAYDNLPEALRLQIENITRESGLVFPLSDYAVLGTSSTGAAWGIAVNKAIRGAILAGNDNAMRSLPKGWVLPNLSQLILWEEKNRTSLEGSSTQTLLSKSPSLIKGALRHALIESAKDSGQTAVCASLLQRARAVDAAVHPRFSFLSLFFWLFPCLRNSHQTLDHETLRHAVAEAVKYDNGGAILVLLDEGKLDRGAFEEILEEARSGDKVNAIRALLSRGRSAEHSQFLAKMLACSAATSGKKATLEALLANVDENLKTRLLGSAIEWAIDRFKSQENLPYIGRAIPALLALGNDREILNARSYLDLQKGIQRAESVLEVALAKAIRNNCPSAVTLLAKEGIITSRQAAYIIGDHFCYNTKEAGTALIRAIPRWNKEDLKKVKNCLQYLSGGDAALAAVREVVE